MFLNVSKEMEVVFELKVENESDKEHVSNVQKLTLNKEKKSGLKGSLGLYSSPEWWNNIEKGLLKHKVIFGKIVRVYHAGQDSSKKINSIDIELDNGNIFSSGIYVNNKADVNLFKVGRVVAIYYVLDELKNGDYIDIVVEMAISIN